MTSFASNENQTDSSFNDPNILKIFEEPNIRKAKFIVSSDRIYTLEFDQNIEMQELKTMIQKAAHLRKNTFSLFNNGQDYTQYTEETFDTFFPDQDLVVFTLEIQKGASFDETELLVQIKNPCPEHDYKFLLYYCFDCGKSICSECFTNGVHKGHKIQDKCFYLLPSKYLVDKMFSNWSKKPYEDYNISVDLNEFKNQLNNVTFKQLFDMLKETQRKCNELIDKYNTINQQSLGNIRDSIRDIKITCIKALDEYKDVINIKDIINNEEVFLDFDHTYKDLGKKQKERFNNNVLVFQELNKGVSILVQNLINDICQMINDTLLKALDNRQYDEVQQKINSKLIKPVNKDDIINQLSGKKIKNMRIKKIGRKTMMNNNNYNNLVNKISQGVENKLEKIKENNQRQNLPGRNTIIPENLNTLKNFENINNINNDFDMENSEQSSNDKINNNFNNAFSINDINGNKNNSSIDSSFQKPTSIINDKNIENKNNYTQLLNNTNANNSNNPIINDFNGNSNNNITMPNKGQNQNDSDIQMENSNQNNDFFEKPRNIFDNNNINNNISNNDNNKQNNKMINNDNPFIQQANNIAITNTQQLTDIIKNQNGKDINNNSNDKQAKNIFGSILEDNKNNTENKNNIFNTVSNKKQNTELNIFSGNDISPIFDNRALNSNNDNCSNNSSLNNDINNINSAQAKRQMINNNINNDIQNNQNPIKFENNNNSQISNENSNQKNLILSSPFSQISSNNNNNIFNGNIGTANSKNTNSNMFNNNNIETTSTQNTNGNASGSAGQNKNININDSRYLAGLARNCKTILEEANESESDIKSQKEKNINIEYYLKKPYILCPIPTTNKLKIVTEDLSDENIISLNFPSNSNITTFLYNCAHCNYNKRLYISGGIINPGTFEKMSNKFYMIDLSKINSNNNDNAESLIVELSPMLYNRCNHSLIGYNNEIYAVGGENLNSVEKYDIEKDEWIEIGSMIKKRSRAMLAIHNEYLYAFFGKGEDENNYPESIERVNITNNNSFWEMILYSNPSNINTKLYGCALYQIDNDLIYFIGGKYDEAANDEIFYFHLNDRRFARTDSKLVFKESFRENRLFQLGNKIVQISDGKFSGVYLTIYVQ